MKNAVCQVNVINVTEQEFTDKETKQKKKYYRCTSQSQENEIYIFNSYDEVPPEVGSIFGLYVEPDRLLKPRFIFRRLK